MISQNQVTKGSCDFERESLIESHDPTTFGGHRHFGSGDVLSLSRDLPKPSDFAKSDGHRYYSSKDIMILVCCLIL